LYCEDFAERKNFFSKSKEVTLITKLNVDLFNTDLDLPWGIAMRLELYTNPSNRCLCRAGNANFKLQILNCELKMKYVEALPSLKIAFQRYWLRETVKIPIRRLTTRMINIDNGVTDLALTHIFTGQRPVRLFAVFIDSDTFNGNYSNILKFKLDFLREIQFYCNGIPFPTLPLELDQSKKKLLEAYGMLQNTLHSQSSGEWCSLTYKKFAEDSGVIGIDLSPDASGSANYFSPQSTASLEVKAKFVSTGIANTHGLKLLVLLEHQNVISIDANCNFALDYNV